MIPLAEVERLRALRRWVIESNDAAEKFGSTESIVAHEDAVDEWRDQIDAAAPSLILAASTAITLEAFLREHGERIRELMTGSDAYSPANDDRITDALSELLATLGKDGAR